MPEKPTSKGTQSNGSAPPTRPAPPPFRPKKDLIGYIEKGQNPPTRPEPPREKH